MTDKLTLLYKLPCIYYVYVTFFFNVSFAYHFSGKNCASPTPFFVTELHNYGCADITSLNEMFTCSWDKHTHVFSSQLAPTVFGFKFYVKRRNKLHRSTFCKSKLIIFICHNSSSRNDSKCIWSLINYFQIKEIFIFLSEVHATIS